MKGGKNMPGAPPSSPQEVAVLIGKPSAAGLMISGGIIPAIVPWLMIFKPF